MDFYQSFFYTSMPCTPKSTTPKTFPFFHRSLTGTTVSGQSGGTTRAAAAAGQTPAPATRPPDRPPKRRKSTSTKRSTAPSRRRARNSPTPMLNTLIRYQHAEMGKILPEKGAIYNCAF